VIPCYNQARFLGEAIESALAQTYPHVEVVVVDDGSTDDTSEVASRYPGVRCVRQDNRGLAGARNEGIRRSRGGYLVFLDADDRLLPNALAVGLKHLKERPECAFTSGRYRDISADGSPLPTWEQPCPDGEHYLEMLRANYIFMPAVVMHRRRVLESVGGFDTFWGVRGCEDYELCLRVARGFPVHCHGELVVEYRWHGANMSRGWAMMLKNTLAVLGSQRELVKGSRRHEEAIEEGARAARNYFYGQLAYGILAHARKGEWGRAVRGLLALARHHPWTFVRAWRKLGLPGRLRHWLRIQ